jgi:hypothetical protein
MSQKTDTPEFAPGFLWQIILLTIVALCIVLVSRGTLSWNLTGGSERDAVSVPVTLYPWVYGGGRTIANGLRAFSGQPPVMAPIALRAATLMLILISMVVCPTLFLLEWRRRRLKDEAAAAGRPPLRMSGIMYILCGWITIVSGFGLIPVAYVSETTTASLRHAQAVQGNRDEMVNELNFLSVNAAQYYILPKVIDGGGRNFEGYSIPEKLAKTEEAAYTAIDGKNTVSFHAVSLRDPSCTIDVQIDSIGRMAGWKYGGEFQ